MYRTSLVKQREIHGLNKIIVYVRVYCVQGPGMGRMLSAPPGCDPGLISPFYRNTYLLVSSTFSVKSPGILVFMELLEMFDFVFLFVS